MMKNKRIKKNWSEEDVQILIWIISKYCDQKGYRDIEKQLDSQDWKIIASLIPGANADSCMFKWLSLKKTNLSTNNWSQQESQILSKLVRQKGLQCKNKDAKDWKLVSQKLYLLNDSEDKIFRNAKQCREHWNCYLNPSLKKGPWKPQEDVQLLQRIKKNKGSKKWSQIVRFLKGRTENALKNRFTLIMDKLKRLKHNKNKNQLALIEEYLLKSYLDQFTTDIKKQQKIAQNQSYSDSLSLSNDMVQNASNSFEERMNLSDKAQKVNESSQCINRMATNITPYKIQRFTGFSGFHQFISMSIDKIDLNSIQIGTLNNGIFQKTETEIEKSNSSINLSKYSIKRYNSCLL